MSTQNYVTERQLVGVGYAMISVTTLIFGARTFIRIQQPKSIQADDYFLLLAYLCFLTLTILYIVLAPTMYRVTNASSGITPLYPGILSDSLFMIKIFFANTMIFWFTLWAVKFSFLALYRRLMRPTSQKVGIGGLFCIAWVCIAFATIRVIQIGVKAGNSSTPSSSWLALWGIVESAVAVIVGCCPGLYTRAKEVRSTRKSTSKKSTGQSYIYGSRGYEKQTAGPNNEAKVGYETTISAGRRSPNAVASHSRSIELKRIPSKAGNQKNSQKGIGTFWVGDETSSQEELNSHNHIYVRSSVEVKDEDDLFPPGTAL
ncbi:hypothetical protein H2200_010606 [Cladophialophora chaetospira]|uniref:Integral membrane protein n=1 Tax=Cladophialophora chaetospira TaxID=386627 RepID=A0AA38X1S6_9EURO|nr:hypothetical protein H2200_010606 [Cladophialophora chaetospira]